MQSHRQLALMFLIAVGLASLSACTDLTEPHTVADMEGEAARLAQTHPNGLSNASIRAPTIPPARVIRGNSAFLALYDDSGNVRRYMPVTFDLESDDVRLLAAAFMHGVSKDRLRGSVQEEKHSTELSSPVSGILHHPTHSPANSGLPELVDAGLEEGIYSETWVQSQGNGATTQWTTADGQLVASQFTQYNPDDTVAWASLIGYESTSGLIVAELYVPASVFSGGGGDPIPPIEELEAYGIDAISCSVSIDTGGTAVESMALNCDDAIDQAVVKRRKNSSMGRAYIRHTSSARST